MKVVTSPISWCLSLFILHFVFCFWSSNTIWGFSGCTEAALSSMKDVKEGTSLSGVTIPKLGHRKVRIFEPSSAVS